MNFLKLAGFQREWQGKHFQAIYHPKHTKSIIGKKVRGRDGAIPAPFWSTGDMTHRVASQEMKLALPFPLQMRWRVRQQLILFPNVVTSNISTIINNESKVKIVCWDGAVDTDWFEARFDGVNSRRPGIGGLFG